MCEEDVKIQEQVHEQRGLLIMIQESTGQSTGPGYRLCPVTPLLVETLAQLYLHRAWIPR